MKHHHPLVARTRRNVRAKQRGHPQKGVTRRVEHLLPFLFVCVASSFLFSPFLKAPNDEHRNEHAINTHAHLQCRCLSLLRIVLNFPCRRPHTFSFYLFVRENSVHSQNDVFEFFFLWCACVCENGAVWCHTHTQICIIRLLKLFLWCF